MKKIMWVIFPFLLLAACGNSNDDTSGAGEMMEEIIVEINTAKQAEVSENFILSATVTQGGEPVEDADEVVYEVWQSGHREGSEMIEAEHKEDGIYEAETVFEEDGLYYMQAHTTARRLHMMPKQEITVGNPDPETIVPEGSEDSHGMNTMKEHSGH